MGVCTSLPASFLQLDFRQQHFKESALPSSIGGDGAADVQVGEHLRQAHVKRRSTAMQELLTAGLMKTPLEHERYMAPTNYLPDGEGAAIVHGESTRRGGGGHGHGDESRQGLHGLSLSLKVVGNENRKLWS